MGDYHFTDLNAGVQLCTAGLEQDGADHHFLAPLGYLGGRAYLVLRDFCLPLADGRAHAAHSRYYSSIIHFVSSPSVRSPAL